uniref:Reverse transcriptase domain-containing protein n=1 Tax=Lactuca sativa TaxID=4236 RepID=A0A9R1UXZ0_LACSA|nr:hypothetical protein LSAT_V11C700351060 [Lactuca sativa]
MASVLINSFETKEFPITKGIRQGDSLFPFLFIIAMEGLNAKSISHCVSTPNNGPVISHLFYADDALFVGNWESSNFSNLSRILRCFHASLGLKVNFHKSKVYHIGVPDNEVSTCARILRCDPGAFPLNYLGAPIGKNMSLEHNWKPIVERVNKKLASWKANSLSSSGRLNLTNVVLGSLPLYYFSLFKAPKSILKNLEWSWKQFLHVVEFGLACQMVMAFNEDRKSLWKRVICSIHNNNRKHVGAWAKRSLSGVWFNIVKIIPHINDLEVKFSSTYDICLGNGKGTLFWIDDWIESDVKLSIGQDKWKSKLSGDGCFYIG